MAHRTPTRLPLDRDGLGGGTTISLVGTGEDPPAGIDTGVRVASADARAAHVAVRDLGLDAGELLDWQTAPLMFSFVDPDGSRFCVSETPGSVRVGRRMLADRPRDEHD